MWLFTVVGFFSVVQKSGASELTIRARVKDDLAKLKERYLPELGEVLATPHHDYPWRAICSHEALAQAMGTMIRDLHYANFKAEVAKVQGSERAHRYHEVWSVMCRLGRARGGASDRGAKPGAAKRAARAALAYGGVVFDPRGRVLLREPKNHFDDYVWTFPKGRPNPGESPQAAALRETSEETGVSASIVAEIPGEFPGGTSINHYFLMTAPAGSGRVTAQNTETASIRWVEVEEARALLALSVNELGRRRDLAVLEAALRLRRDLNAAGGPLSP